MADAVRQGQAHQGGAVFDDGQTGLIVRRGDIRHQAPFEAGTEAIVQQGHLPSGAVGGHDDLVAGLIQGIEGMEKLILYLFLAGHELDIVH